jgi:hypothetical protein
MYRPFRSNKTIIIALILLFGILNVKTSCYRERLDEIAQPRYEFRQDLSLTPYNLDYKVGDTIWFELNTPGKRLLDEKTNSLVLYDSAGFASMVVVDLLYNNPYVANGPFVSFIFPAGISARSSTSGPQTFGDVQYGCAPSPDYHLLLGMVLLQKGAFGISMINYAVKKCINNSNPPARLTYYFNVNDAHEQFYQQLPFSAIGKQADTNVISRLNKKLTVVINVN